MIDVGWMHHPGIDSKLLVKHSYSVEILWFETNINYSSEQYNPSSFDTISSYLAITFLQCAFLFRTGKD